ncbi:MAG: hypothetical protein D3908_11845 [Candidatus Electrothrix sp. AUS4]|nr:hypothetical protein [Candidatus Electrothrix sp. AUS4]
MEVCREVFRLKQGSVVVESKKGGATLHGRVGLVAFLSFMSAAPGGVEEVVGRDDQSSQTPLIYFDLRVPDLPATYLYG